MRLPEISSLVLALLLLSCEPSGVSVYDKNDNRVGRVNAVDKTHADLYDRDGSRAGKVTEDEVFDRDGTRVGRVTSDDRILNRSGTQVGRVSEGTKCLDTGGDRVGRIAEDIDDEAAGGACLVLLLPMP